MGLSKLSLGWMKLGIVHERIQAGRPQQNGRHERMHRTLKEDTTVPPAASLRAQQSRFDNFRYMFNNERPHEGLNNQVPASLYIPSSIQLPRKFPEFTYPKGSCCDESTIAATSGGTRAEFHQRSIPLRRVGSRVNHTEALQSFLSRHGDRTTQFRRDSLQSCAKSGLSLSMSAAACSRQLNLRCREIMRHNAHMGLTQEAAAGSDCPFAGDVYMYGVPSKADCTFRSPVDESKKSTVRFFRVLIPLKATMRFEEGYGHIRRWHSTPTHQFTSQLPGLGFQQRP